MEAVGDELHGWAEVRPTMWAPGTEMLRASVAMTWADALLGLHALKALAPRLTVTLELDAHLFDDVAGVEIVRARSRLVKAGQAVIFTTLDFLADDGRLVGFGSGSFMAIPDQQWTAPPLDDVLVRFATPRGTLVEPLAERVGCERTAPGTAVLPCTPAVYNATRAINGGMLAVAVEEAALSADPDARWIESMHLRYLRSVRVGPAVAHADVHYGTGRVEVRDASTDKVAAIATTRSRG
jgi:acyl-coenzyme A thioesterase PaaI-like protein